MLKNINIDLSEKEATDVNISISVSGSYKNFISFLRRIEKSLRLIDVSGLSFSTGKDDFYDFSLEAVSYIQKWKKIYAQ